MINTFQFKQQLWRFLHKINLLPYYFQVEYWLKPRFPLSEKVFCIGRNKTGTTSVEVLFEELGYKISPRLPSELLVDDWEKGKFDGIIRFSKYAASAFKDMPYSLPETYKHIEKALPESKFILTVRPVDQWYDSILRYAKKLHSKNDDLPTREDLQNSTYVRKGWAYENTKRIMGLPDDDLFNESILKTHYENYNAAVLSYFKDKPGKLLVVDVSAPDSAAKICEFLGTEKVVEKMPWVNKT